MAVAIASHRHSTADYVSQLNILTSHCVSLLHRNPPDSVRDSNIRSRNSNRHTLISWIPTECAETDSSNSYSSRIRLAIRSTSVIRNEAFRDEKGHTRANEKWTSHCRSIGKKGDRFEEDGGREHGITGNR